MVDRHDLSTYAAGLAGALRALGPTHYKRVIGMLEGLGLANEDARAVVTSGIASGILVEDDGKLDVGPAFARDANKHRGLGARSNITGRLRSR